MDEQCGKKHGLAVIRVVASQGTYNKGSHLQGIDGDNEKDRSRCRPTVAEDEVEKCDHLDGLA